MRHTNRLSRRRVPRNYDKGVLATLSEPEYGRTVGYREMPPQMWTGHGTVGGYIPPGLMTVGSNDPTPEPEAEPLAVEDGKIVLDPEQLQALSQKDQGFFERNPFLRDILIASLTAFATSIAGVYAMRWVRGGPKRRIEKLERELEEDGDLMTPDEKRRLEREIERLEREMPT